MSPEIFNYISLSGMSILGWLARELWTAVKDLRMDMVNLKDYIAQNYTRKDDFKEFRSELLQVLQRIEGKLDTKQDK